MMVKGVWVAEGVLKALYEGVREARLEMLRRDDSDSVSAERLGEIEDTLAGLLILCEEV